MRVLYLNSNYKGEGTYNRCFRIARELLRKGVEVTLLTVTDKPPSLRIQRREEEGVRLIELPALSRRRDYLGYLLRPWLGAGVALRERFDLVHAFTVAEPLVWLTAAMLHRRRRKRPFPIVVDWDDWYSRGGLVELKPARPILRPLTTYWEESLPRIADVVTVVSEALRQRAHQLGIAPERIYRIGNGADPQPFERLDKAACRERRGLPQDGVIALYMGGYNQALPIAVRAFLKAAQGLPQAHFVCVGEVSIRHHHLKADAPLMEQVQGDPRFHFLGRVAGGEVPEYLAAADVFLLPMADTLVERARFPIRLGDYLSAGRALIVSDIGEVGRIVQKHGCGLLARDEAEFTRRLSSLLRDPDRRERLGLLARRAANSALHWEKVAGEMLSVYTSLLPRREEEEVSGEPAREQQLVS